ncbi:MAG: lysophospholipid acyltransferase family protein [Methylocystis sp.]
MPYLRALAFVLALAFFVICVAPLQALARRRDWPMQHKIQTFFCRTMCRLIGIEVIPVGKLPATASRFVVANHVSWTDIIAIASLYPLVFLAKSEVAGWPVLGFLARLQGTIFVDRANRRVIPEVNAALARELRAGRDVVVFAEGTSSDGGKVLKFNASHFAMLSELGREREIAVVPTAFAYAPREECAENSTSFDAGWYGDMSFVPHLWGLMRRGGARCHVYFGEAVDASVHPDRKALADETRERVRRLLELGSFARAEGGL